MNVNPRSNRFTEVVAWDSLTDAEKASGDWIQLPDVSQARRASEIEKAFGSPRAKAVAKAFNEGENRYRQTVLSQGPLPGYPVVKESSVNSVKDCGGIASDA